MLGLFRTNHFLRTRDSVKAWTVIIDGRFSVDSLIGLIARILKLPFTLLARYKVNTYPGREMNKINFETKIKPADRFLQDYQVD